MKIMKQFSLVRYWVIALVLLAASGVHAAGPWYVATNGLDSNAGTSWSVPFLTLSNALANASSGGDTIWVSNGVYAIGDTVNNSAAKKCKICAWSTNAADTVLQGPGSGAGANFRGVYMEGAGSTLQGFTVRNFCTTNMSGAGVYCISGLITNCVIASNVMDGGYQLNGGGVSLAGGTIANCSITGNLMTSNCTSQAFGAGIYAANASLIAGCDIAWNTNAGASSQWGGGVYLTGSGTEIRKCQIMGNWAGASGVGAGISAWGKGTIIRDCIVASNTTAHVSGGIAGGEVISNCQVFANQAGGYGGRGVQYSWIGQTKVTIVDCLFSNNVATSQGGIGCENETNILVSGCVIVNNRSERGGTCGLTAVGNVVIRNCLAANNLGCTVQERPDGGMGGTGMRVSSSATNALIENCTIVSNRVVRNGSYAFTGVGLQASGTRVVNSITYHNTAGTPTTLTNVSASADCTFSNSCTAPLTGLTGTGNIDADPQFVSKATGDFRLKGGSPCIDAGLYSAWMPGAVDLDGLRRISGSQVDIGAFEYLYKATLMYVR